MLNTTSFYPGLSKVAIIEIIFFISASRRMIGSRGYWGFGIASKIRKRRGFDNIC